MASLMNFCNVSGCRFPHTHVTSFHQCGKCKCFGHGQRECQIFELRHELTKYENDIIPQHLQCKVPNCQVKIKHTTKGHCCHYCGKRETHIKQCPNNPNFSSELFTKPGTVGVVNPLDNYFAKNINNGYYTDVYDGMGCGWFVRNNNGKLETLFMHSDSWGQYGEDSSELPIYIAFTFGYKRVENKNQVIF